MVHFWQRKNWAVIDKFIQRNYRRPTHEIIDNAEDLPASMIIDIAQRVRKVHLEPYQQKLKCSEKNTDQYQTMLDDYNQYKNFVNAVKSICNPKIRFFPQLCCTG